MLKRHTPTADEIRNRRIRRSWLISFSLVILLLLLSVAWFGAMAVKRVAPRKVVPTDEPLGEFTFHVRTFFQDPAVLLREAEDAPNPLGKAPHEVMLRDALAPTGQVLYWQDEQSGEEEALIYISMVRPRRIYLRRLDSILSSSSALAKSGDTLSEDQIGHFVLDGRGLFIFTSPRMKTFNLETFNGAEPAWEAQYISESGYVPQRLHGVLGSIMEERHAGSPISVTWWREGDDGRIEVSFRESPDGPVVLRELDYVNPITNESPP